MANQAGAENASTPRLDRAPLGSTHDRALAPGPAARSRACHGARTRPWMVGWIDGMDGVGSGAKAHACKQAQQQLAWARGGREQPATPHVLTLSRGASPERSSPAFAVGRRFCPHLLISSSEPRPFVRAVGKYTYRSATSRLRLHRTKQGRKRQAAGQTWSDVASATTISDDTHTGAQGQP